VPEGDTIHSAARRIAPVLEGVAPEEITTPNPRHGMDRWPERLAGKRVGSVDPYGKHLFLRFEGGLTVHSHLRMTGWWGVYRRGQRWGRSSRRAWLVLRTREHEVVQFDGPVLELLTEARARGDRRLLGLGPDILAPTFDEQAFLRRLREDDPTRTIGDAIIDQRTVAGIGNLWKAEACFAAEMDPWRRTADVTDAEALALVHVARTHMREAVEKGHNHRPRAVYRRAGMTCARCKDRIRSRGQGDDNRMTYWCPGCQR
jgi:endonuclease VIII